MRATVVTRFGSDVMVTIAATNPKTLDGLSSYLRGAGIGARCTRDLAECTTERNVAAVVIFPDDFRWEKVEAALAELAGVRPLILTVLVTAHPQKFEKLRAAEKVIIMPRPVWGWTILDLIRAQIECQESDRVERK
jgi:hypothetical protein